MPSWRRPGRCCRCRTSSTTGSEREPVRRVHPRQRPRSASTSGRGWSTELLREFGIRTELFPPLVEPGTSIGSLRGEVAAEAGLRGTDARRRRRLARHGERGRGDPRPRRHERLHQQRHVERHGRRDAPSRSSNVRVLATGFTNEGGVGGKTLLAQEPDRAVAPPGMPPPVAARGPDYGWDRAARARGALRSRSGRSIDPDAPEFLNPTDMPAAIRDFCLPDGAAGAVGRRRVRALLPGEPRAALSDDARRSRRSWPAEGRGRSESSAAAARTGCSASWPPMRAACRSSPGPPRRRRSATSWFRRSPRTSWRASRRVARQLGTPSSWPRTSHARAIGGPRRPNGRRHGVDHPPAERLPPSSTGGRARLRRRRRPRPVGLACDRDPGAFASEDRDALQRSHGAEGSAALDHVPGPRIGPTAGG